jgi:hypothetical protein|tara:strand:+ start:561 stop:707 length:147 start_codon:yes stop_codon:yes gene_type:complete
MAKMMGQASTIEHVKKRTTIGRGRLKMSSMNKHKRRSYKPYNGQGKRK